MALDPEAEAVLAELAAKAKPMPADEREWLDGYRAELDAIVAQQGPTPHCTVVDVPGARGRPALRLYRPSENVAPWPSALFIHGGGFVAGSLAGYDIPLRHLALRSGWQIVAVDYRLAPEHPFPAAPNDCFAALAGLHDDPSLEADARRLAVVGDSAGGLLATVTAARARDAGLRPALQVLLYPNTDVRPGPHHASRAEHDGKVVCLDELYRSLDAYLGEADRTQPHASPLLAPDLAGLCPCLLVTAENDPLRDEAEAYGVRLREAGVAVEVSRLEGQIHSIFQRASRIAAGDRLITRVAQALKSALKRA